MIILRPISSCPLGVAERLIANRIRSRKHRDVQAVHFYWWEAVHRFIVEHVIADTLLISWTPLDQLAFMIGVKG